MIPATSVGGIGLYIIYLEIIGHKQMLHLDDVGTTSLTVDFHYSFLGDKQFVSAGSSIVVVLKSDNENGYLLKQCV